MQRLVPVIMAGAMTLAASGAVSAEPAPIPVKVMIVSMFGPEREVWTAHRELGQTLVVPGLSPDYPDVRCGSDGACLVTTGMGHSNAAASIAALVYSHRFDLRHTYWLIAGIAGIAGIAPARGTLGSAAWARYLVDGGLQWELDEREAPKDWPSGYTGINTNAPDQKPSFIYRTEVFKLNEALLQNALSLSKTGILIDGPDAQKTRSTYPAAPANQPPAVIQCDSLTSDTWFSGAHLGARATEWMRTLTDGQGVYCTAQQEDNAIYEVLKRATAAGFADDERVADLRTASDFDRAPPGGNETATLLNYQSQGGFPPAVANLYQAGNPLVEDIVTHWSAWEKGVPVR